MKGKFLQDISSNSMQVIINQLCGLYIFYILSICLGKNDFGEINWSLALLLTSFTILSFGIDQVSVKRIASGGNEKTILSNYFSHVLLSGILLYGLLLLGSYLFHPFFKQHQLLLLLGIGKLMIFFSTPFKQLATGKEKFRPLMFMCISSNLVKSLSLLMISLFFQLNLSLIIGIFIIADTVEFIVSVLITKQAIKVPVMPAIQKHEYKSLLKESLPQLGVTIFTSAIARFDWILLGLMGSAVVLAEYSFAYKVFEMASLPLLVIAPVLIPKFTRYFSAPEIDNGTADKLNTIFVLLRIEMAIAACSGMTLTLIWTPVIDTFTFGKYGLVNQYTIFILSACLPFLYFNNILWTINFAKGRLKMIFYLFAISFIINIAGDIILIPLYKAEGAALAFLLANLVQSGIFLYHTKLEGLLKNSHPLLLSPAAAILSGYTAISLFHQPWLILLFACLLFFAILLLTRQIRSTDWLKFKRIIGL